MGPLVGAAGGAGQFACPDPEAHSPLVEVHEATAKMARAVCPAAADWPMAADVVAALAQQLVPVSAVVELAQRVVGFGPAGRHVDVLKGLADVVAALAVAVAVGFAWAAGVDDVAACSVAAEAGVATTPAVFAVVAAPPDVGAAEAVEHIVPPAL